MYWTNPHLTDIALAILRRVLETYTAEGVQPESVIFMQLNKDLNDNEQFLK